MLFLSPDKFLETGKPSEVGLEESLGAGLKKFSLTELYFGHRKDFCYNLAREKNLSAFQKKKTDKTRLPRPQAF